MQTDDDPDLQAGRDLASLLLPMIQDGADDALNPQMFWSGYIAAVIGWASVTVDLRAIINGIASEVQSCPPVPGGAQHEEMKH